MLNKLKQKLKNRKPMEPKRKALVKGLVFGFLAGGLATLTAVGIVGCSITQGESKQPQSHKLNKEPQRKEALTNGSVSFYVINPVNNTNPSTSSTTNDTLVLGAGNVVGAGASIGTLEPSQLASFTWVTMQTFANDNGYLGIGTKYAPISRYSGIAKVTVNLSFVNWDTTYISPYWKRKVSNSQTSYYRQSISVNNSYFPSNEELENYCLDLTGLTPSNNSMPYPTTASVDFTDLFVPMSDVFIGYEMPSASSSEESSGDASTDVSFESLDKGGSVTFNDRNAFSAWVVNPKSLDRATSYDGGAPWLLYTGSPTDDNTNHSTIATKYELYDVGRFHVYGNDGVTFDKIGITTQNLSADNVLTLDGETATQVSAAMYEKGAFRVTGIKYVNSASNQSVDVYKEAWSVVDMSGNSVYALSGGRWLNEGFRTIVIDDVDGSLTILGYQASVAWWLENNALSSSDAVATMVLGNSSTGVFGLLASAFGSMGAIFGIALIPGLTLGTLIFVPLVVLIIFAIIKLLAK